MNWGGLQEFGFTEGMKSGDLAHPRGLAPTTHQLWVIESGNVVNRK